MAKLQKQNVLDSFEEAKVPDGFENKTEPSPEIGQN